MSLPVERLTPHCGGLVRDFDLAAPLSDATVAAIERALADHHVLVFRGQDLSPERQIALSRRFGALEDFPEKAERHPESAKVFNITNIGPDGKLFGPDHPNTKYLRIVEYWHTDSSYRRVPSLYTCLYAVEVPDGSHGGQTEFASLTHAYDTLAEDVRARVEGLTAIHTYSQTRVMVLDLPPMTEAERQSLPPVEHPVVRAHPVSGAKALFVTAHSPRIAGLPAGEGELLLHQLVAHATRPEVTYRHEWKKGDFLVWDNRHTLHRVIPYDPTKHRRRMHRTCVAGREAVR